MQDSTLSIGQVAKQSGVGVETLRFYEREGLIDAPERKASSGYRQYPPSAVRRIRFIRHAKCLGFSLKEIQELLHLRVDPKSTCKTIRSQTEAKISNINERIASLEQMRSALQRMTQQCHGDGPTSDCPILEELDRDPFVQHALDMPEDSASSKEMSKESSRS